MPTNKISSDSKLEEVKNKLRVAILSGSTGEDSRSRALATAYGKYLTEHGADVDTIDMRDLGDLPDVMTGDTSFIDPYLDRFSNADAFVVSTPIYNWGPSGKVKHFLDLAMDSDSMSYKPYSLLSGAGSSRSALALGGLANQIDMELKGIGIGAGVQAAGHDYNEETGTLTDDIVSRANENAAKLLQVAGALRGKTASHQDPLILGYKTGQKLAYAAFGRRFRTKLGEDLPMGVPDGLPGDMAPPPADMAPPPADMAPPPANLAPRPARKAPPPSPVSTKYPPRPPKPARSWSDSMAQGIDNYMNSHGAAQRGLYTGDNLGQRALHLATARRQAIHGDDPMLGFSTPEEMDAWYAEQARAAAGGYDRAMREKDLHALETSVDMAASGTPLGRLAGLAYSGYRNLSYGREMKRQMDEVLGRIPPDIRDKIQLPSSLRTTERMYSDNPSALAQDTLGGGGLATGLYGFATGSNPLGIAGKAISHLGHKIDTSKEYDGIPGENEQAYYNYFGGRYRGAQALDSTLAATLEHNREYLSQHPEAVGAILGSLYPQQGGLNSSELPIPSSWQEARDMARRAMARTNQIAYDAKLQYPTTYETLFPSKPVPTREADPNPRSERDPRHLVRYH